MTRRLKIALAIAATVGITLGATVALSIAVDFAFALFEEQRLLAVLLPLAGILTWLVYRALGVPFTWGTKHVVGTVPCKGEVSARIVPAIFLGTCLSIACGGSVGKEAAALQMGGGVAASIARRAGLDEDCRRLLCACALACALAVLLGAPVAGALFAVEVLRYRGRDLPHDLLSYGAIALSAACAKLLTWALGLDSLSARIVAPELDVALLAWIVVLVGLCALLSAGFCLALATLRSRLAAPSRHVPALVIGGLAGAAFLLFASGDVFSGTGMRQLAWSLTGCDGPGFTQAGLATIGWGAPSGFLSSLVQVNVELPGWLASGVIELPGWLASGAVELPYFLGKALFTLVILGLGFKGGEIMPTLCIGATFGCFFGAAVGLDPTFMAAIALAAYFSACTNCPLAATALACEAFGPANILWFAFAAFAAYLPTRRIGFYR